MKHVMALAAIILLLLGSRALAHDEEIPHDDVFKIGKNGDVKFDNDMRIGAVLVTKGKYVVAHRVDGDAHVFVLTATGSRNAGEPVIHEVRTKLIPSRIAARSSSVVAEMLKDHSYRVKMVQIAGEFGDHLPDSAGGAEQPAGMRKL